jgi:nitroreductase
MDTLEAIRNRRSIRRQKPDPFDDETLNKILEAGRWAPSWANTQCWRFIVVRDQNIKARLAETRPRMPPPPPGAATPPGAPPRAAVPFSSPIAEAPVVIAVCAELNRSGVRSDGTPSTDKGGSWYMYDTALATQNICLAAHALGLGTVIIGGGFDAIKAAEILQVPEGFTVVVLVPIGFAAEPGRSPTRKELSEIVFYDKFGAK